MMDYIDCRVDVISSHIPSLLRIHLILMRIRILDPHWNPDTVYFVKKIVDPHIFADLDPGSQNLADPTDSDPDPKHCFPFIE